MGARLISTRSNGHIGEDYNYKGSVRRKRSGSRNESNYSLVNSNGEISASNKQDLMNLVANLASDMAEGRLRASTFSDSEELRKAEAEQAELVKAGLADRSQEKDGPASLLGAAITDTIVETTGRIGLVEKFLVKQVVSPGNEGRFRIRQKNVVSWIVTRGSFIPACVVNQPYVYPEVVTINTYITINDVDNATSPIDFMDEKYQDGLEATMVREDNLFRYLLTQAAPVFNPVYTFTNLTPSYWSRMSNDLNFWGLPATSAIIAIDLLTDMRTNSDFLAIYEPYSKLQLIETGNIGKLYETEIYTDGLRYDTLKVLEPGEIFFLTSPGALGGIAEYEPLQSEPVSLHNIGAASRGWYLWKNAGYIIGNSRGAVYGYRSS